MFLSESFQQSSIREELRVLGMSRALGTLTLAIDHPSWLSSNLPFASGRLPTSSLEPSLFPRLANRCLQGCPGNGRYTCLRSFEHCTGPQHALEFLETAFNQYHHHDKEEMIKLTSMSPKIGSLHLTSVTQASGKSGSLSATLEQQALENGGS